VEIKKNFWNKKHEVQEEKSKEERMLLLLKEKTKGGLPNYRRGGGDQD